MEDRTNTPGTVEHFVCDTIAQLQKMVAKFSSDEVNAYAHMITKDLKDKFEAYQAMYLDGDVWTKDKPKEQQDKELKALLSRNVNQLFKEIME